MEKYKEKFEELTMEEAIYLGSGVEIRAETGAECNRPDRRHGGL